MVRLGHGVLVAVRHLLRLRPQFDPIGAVEAALFDESLPQRGPNRIPALAGLDHVPKRDRLAFSHQLIHRFLGTR